MYASPSAVDSASSDTVVTRASLSYCESAAGIQVATRAKTTTSLTVKPKIPSTIVAECCVMASLQKTVDATVASDNAKGCCSVGTQPANQSPNALCNFRGRILPADHWWCRVRHPVPATER